MHRVVRRLTIAFSLAALLIAVGASGTLALSPNASCEAHITFGLGNPGEHQRNAQDPEFGGQCAMAMSEGVSITTNCSILWLSPDDKIYCFFNEDAKRKFLEAPQASLQRAQSSWQDRENLRRLLRQ